MSVNFKSGVTWSHCFCKHGFEQNRAEEKRQEEGKACFNMGLNFPEQHAMHLTIIFTKHRFWLWTVIFLSVSIKVKTFKKFVDNNRRTDIQTGCAHNIPQHRRSSDWSWNKTLQDFFFYLNTSKIADVPPDMYCLLKGMKTINKK